MASEYELGWGGAWAKFSPFYLYHLLTTLRKNLPKFPGAFFFFSFLKIEVLFLSNKTHTFKNTAK